MRGIMEEAELREANVLIFDWSCVIGSDLDLTLIDCSSYDLA